MIRRILSTLALSAAILTAGVAAITATSTTVSASPVGGSASAKDSVKGGDIAVYPITLEGGEETTIKLTAKGGPLILGIFDENKKPIDKVEVEAGETGELTVTPRKTGKYFVCVLNAGKKTVNFTIVAQ